MAKSARARSTCAAGALSERLRRVSSWRSSAVSGRRGSFRWRDMAHLGARGSPHHYTSSHGRRPTSYGSSVHSLRRIVDRMNPVFVSLLTVCGLDELAEHSMRGVTHVLSILDPDWPEPDAFRAYDPHHRTTLQFHDVIEPAPGLILPDVHHVEAIFSFGYSLARDAGRGEGHLLVHCHMGISRSTAAMLVLLAQAHPQEDADRLFERLCE